MEAKINVAAILYDKPQGTKLYFILSDGECFLNEASEDSIYINIDNRKRFWCLSAYGSTHSFPNGCVLLFPSKEMRDWSKFAWKKGDVLVCKDGNSHIIFEKFNDDTYTTFTGKLYYQTTRAGYSYTHTRNLAMTQDFDIEEGDAVQTYIKTIEEKLGGKLNRETLEVEKPKKKPVFELGNLYVFNEEDEDGELTIIGKLIGKNENEDTLTFGNQYEIENEKFVTDQAFDLRISVHEELREATEGEAITFQEACTLWEKSKKQGKDQPPFKTFDKVLVRCGKKSKWLPAFFVRVHEGFPDWKYSVFLICSGKVSYFSDCIPFEGNEQLLGTTKDVED